MVSFCIIKSVTLFPKLTPKVSCTIPRKSSTFWDQKEEFDEVLDLKHDCDKYYRINCEHWPMSNLSQSKYCLWNAMECFTK